jgi:preprotein translocase subunit SecE
MEKNRRIALAAFVGLGVVVWLFVRHIMDTVWGVARLPVPQSWPLTPADVIALVSAVAVFVILRRNNKVTSFVDEVIVELEKVTWPPKKETLLSTVVVAVMVAISAALLFGFDTLWGTLVKLLYQ